MSFLLGLPLFLLLGLGVPLYIVIIALSVILFISGDIPLAATVISFKKLEVQEFLSAIPLFTFAGYALSHSGVPRTILELSQKWLGGFVGSATTISVLIMAFFTALTGASGISILALGSLMYPLLMEASKSEKFSYGLITGSGSIGLLLAPSLPVIIYAIISNQNASTAGRVNIDELFQAALLPTAILLALYILYGSLIEYKGRRNVLTPENVPTSMENGEGKETTQDSLETQTLAATSATATNLSSNLRSRRLKEALFATYQARYELLLPIIVYGGIYWGWLTVLEASLVAFLYTVFLIFVIRREFRFRKDLVRLTIESMKLSGGIFMIMASAFILTNYLVNARIPDQIFAFLAPVLTNPYIFLMTINIFLLLAGCVLDIFSAILILLPLVLPIAQQYGINPYHFAIIFLVNLEIGYLTPPVGLNLFIASYRFKKDILFMYRAAFPFFLLLICALVLFTYVPSLSTFTVTDASTQQNTSSANNANEALPSQTEDNLPPPRIENVRAHTRTSTSLTLVFTPANEARESSTSTGTTSTSATGIYYKIIYIDEAMDEISLIGDLGEEVLISPEEIAQSRSTAGENTDPNASSNEIFYTLTDLIPGTPYSLFVIAVDANDQSSLPSELIMVETLP